MPISEAVRTDLLKDQKVIHNRLCNDYSGLLSKCLWLHMACSSLMMNNYCCWHVSPWNTLCKFWNNNKILSSECMCMYCRRNCSLLGYKHIYMSTSSKYNYEYKLHEILPLLLNGLALNLIFLNTIHKTSTPPYTVVYRDGTGNHSLQYTSESTIWQVIQHALCTISLLQTSKNNKPAAILTATYCDLADKTAVLSVCSEQASIPGP